MNILNETRYHWKQLLEMHNYYSFGADVNEHCKKLLNMLEIELTKRACKSAEILLKELEEEQY